MSSVLVALDKFVDFGESLELKKLETIMNQLEQAILSVVSYRE